jgi:hypothetical protein
LSNALYDKIKNKSNYETIKLLIDSGAKVTIAAIPLAYYDFKILKFLVENYPKKEDLFCEDIISDVMTFYSHGDNYYEIYRYVLANFPIRDYDNLYSKILLSHRFFTNDNHCVDYLIMIANNNKNYTIRTAKQKAMFIEYILQKLCVFSEIDYIKKFLSEHLEINVFAKFNKYSKSPIESCTDNEVGREIMKILIEYAKKQESTPRLDFKKEF